MTSTAELNEVDFGNWTDRDPDYAAEVLSTGVQPTTLELVQPGESPKTRVELLQERWKSLGGEEEANKIAIAIVGKKEYAGRVVNVSRLVIRMADGSLVDEHGVKINPEAIIEDTPR